MLVRGARGERAGDELAPLGGVLGDESGELGRRVRRHTSERQIRGTLHETNGFDQAAALVEGQRAKAILQ